VFSYSFFLSRDYVTSAAVQMKAFPLNQCDDDYEWARMAKPKLADPRQALRDGSDQIRSDIPQTLAC
jgi:hypothetical protein